MNNHIIRRLVVLSIAALLVLTVCGTMPVMAQTLGHCTFYGTATLDGVPLTAADTDVTISLEVPRIGYTTSYTMGSNPAYGNNYVLKVNVYIDPADGPVQGDTAIISIRGIPINEGAQTIGAAFENIELDISATTAQDTTPPSVTNPTATPSAIPADGTTTSELNVTVTDAGGVASVTIDLSAIGGSAATAMYYLGNDVYSTTVTAARGTTPGTHNLQVNATDIYGNSNTSVSIPLTVITDVKPTVSISTDKIEYQPGDTMDITLNLTNPTGTAQNVLFTWYFGIPAYDYWTPIVTPTPVTLPAGADYSIPIPLDIGNWGTTDFNAVWFVALLDPVTYDIIDYDTADWSYVWPYGATGEREITPANISREIEKEINKKFKI